MHDSTAAARFPNDALPHRSVWLRSLDATGVAFALGAAMYFAMTTLFAIANFGWRQPMFDQYRSYRYLLELPFPRNLLELDNGHRPVLPNLFRVAEIHWFDANQLLQLSVGTMCAVTSAVLLALVAWRERALPRAARGVGVMFAALGVFWLANARMLLHGNETLHAYSIVLLIVIAALCMHRAARDSQLRWLLLACAACAAATFCFGPGIATFTAVIASIVLLRLPWRWLIAPIALMSACIAVYIYVLPGNNGVRNMVGLHPLDSARIAAQWIASPWVNAWLGMADPPLEPSLRDGVNRTGLGPLLSSSANGIEHLLNLSWADCALLLGIAGIGAFALRVGLLWLRRESITRLHVVSIALCVFALASAAIIGIGRLQGLRALPSQIFADRYLMWPSLFWAALALLFIPDVVRLRSRALRASGIAFAALLPIALWPTQHAWAEWGAAVYRTAQRSAAAARSGVFDPAVLPDGPDASRRDVEASLASLRERHLAMFAQPGWERFGAPISVAVPAPGVIGASAQVRDTFRDGNGPEIARIEGRVTEGLRELHDRALALIDDRDIVVGFAEPSYVTDDVDALRFGHAVMRGFDGYVVGYEPQRAYRVVLIPGSQDGALLLCPVAAPPPRSVP